MRIVFDTNVLVRSHPGAQGPARRALLHSFSPGHVLIISRFLLAELERILTYPRIEQTLALTPAEIREYFRDLAVSSEFVIPSEVPAGLLRDEDDIPVLGTAVAGRADVLCTRDRGFRDAAVQRFCSDRGIRTINELELLQSPDFQPQTE